MLLTLYTMRVHGRMMILQKKTDKTARGTCGSYYTRWLATYGNVE